MKGRLTFLGSTVARRESNVGTKLPYVQIRWLYWLTVGEQEEVVEMLINFNCDLIKWDNKHVLPLKAGGMTDLYINLRNGRKPVITKIVLPNERSVVYEHIRKEIKNGRQIYIICPRINEPDPARELAVQAKSTKNSSRVS